MGALRRAAGLGARLVLDAGGGAHRGDERVAGPSAHLLRRGRAGLPHRARGPGAGGRAAGPVRRRLRRLQLRRVQRRRHGGERAAHPPRRAERARVPPAAVLHGADAALGADHRAPDRRLPRRHAGGGGRAAPTQGGDARDEEGPAARQGGRARRAAAPGVGGQEAAGRGHLDPPRGPALPAGAARGGHRRQDARGGWWRLLPAAHALRPQAPGGGGAREARRPGGAVPVRAPRARDLVVGRALSGAAARRGTEAGMRIALVGPLAPWRGGLAQYLALLGEALARRAEVRAVTFTRQYPGAALPRRLPARPGRAAARLPGRGPARLGRPALLAAHRPPPRALRPGGGGAQVVDALLRPVLRLLGGAFAETWHPGRAGVRQSAAPREAALRPGADGLDAAQLGRLPGHVGERRARPGHAQAGRAAAGACRTRSTPSSTAAASPARRRGRGSGWIRPAEVVLFFGYVRRYKGLDTLLDAWPAVRARRPATLVVAGDFYEDPAPYRAQAAAACAAGGRDAVRLREGYQSDEDVEALFRAADVVVLPYRSATQSGVTHVAYALGVPVITTDVGGLAETVRPGETGLVVPPGDPAALAAAVVRYFEEDLGPGLRAGVRALRAAHSWEALADSTSGWWTRWRRGGGGGERGAARTAAARRPGSTGRTALALGVAAFLLFALSGGGRVVGSDEVTMLELSRAMLRGSIAVPEGSTLRGPDGRHYTKNAAGQAVLALPVVALAEAGDDRAAAGSGAARPGGALRRLVLRRAGDGAAARAPLRGGARAGRGDRRGARPRRRCSASPAPAWIYAKSFMAEPLQALGLLLALLRRRCCRRRRSAAARSRFALAAGLGVLLAVSVKLAMLPLALACLVPMFGAPATRVGSRRRWDWRWRSPGTRATTWRASARSSRPATARRPRPPPSRTPALVGLYGLLLSSGKGVAWFAPALWLAPRGWWAATRRARQEPRALERADAGRARGVGRAGAVGRWGWRSTAASSTGRATAPSGRATWCRCCRGRSCWWPSRCTAPRAALRRARAGAGAGGPAGHAGRRGGLLRRADARGRRLPLHAAARGPGLHERQPLQPALQPHRRALAHAGAQRRRAPARRAGRG